MNINDYVIYTGTGATPYQERVANKALKIGEHYQIERIIEGNWFGFLVLKGIKGQFAIEMFKYVFVKDVMN